MADDILDLPQDDWEEQPAEQADVPAAGAGTQIRTMNANMGAIRVDVGRKLPAVRRQILELAAMVGDQWEYALPFNKRDKATGQVTKELVRGPSIRCTTAIARCWGNCNIDAEVTSETNAAYYINGIFLDVETGFRLSRPFRQRKDQNIGSMGGDRGRVEDVVFQIGVSKAQRNAVRNALPDICEMALEEARRGLAKKIDANKPSVLERILERFEEFGIAVERVEKFYQIKLTGDTALQTSSKVLAQIVRMLQSIADQLVKPEELWRAEDAPAGGGPLKEHDEPRDEDAQADKAKAANGNGKPADAKPAADTSKPAADQGKPVAEEVKAQGKPAAEDPKTEAPKTEAPAATTQAPATQAASQGDDEEEDEQTAPAGQGEPADQGAASPEAAPAAQQAQAEQQEPAQAVRRGRGKGKQSGGLFTE